MSQLLPANTAHTRADFAAIANWVKPNARVLDLGCGDGSLLQYLKQVKNSVGYGVEINDENIFACINNGINVIQSDLEIGLSSFESNSFDYIILSQTLQAMHHIENLIEEIMRVGKEGIVTFPNFGYWANRWQILKGKMPVSEALPYQWYDTPNIHLCTIRDFELFCQRHQLSILGRIVMHRDKQIHTLPNWFGSLAVFRFNRTVDAITRRKNKI